MYRKSPKIILRTGPDSRSNHSFSSHLGFVWLKLPLRPTYGEEIYLKTKTNSVLFLAGANYISRLHLQQICHMINSLVIENSAIVLFKDISFVHVSLDPIDAMKCCVKDVVTDG